jgi:ATP-dependent Clp protease ATP-binding subunit ClpA
MFERFTDSSRMAMAMANREAIRLGLEHISANEMLLGMLLVPSCVAVVIFETLGVDLVSLRSRLEDQAQGASKANMAQPPHPKLAIEFAIRIARELKDEHAARNSASSGLSHYG